MDVRPFTIAVEDSVLEDLQQRLADTRWPDEIPNTGWDYGSNLAYLKELVEHWRTKFDWRAQEAKLNAFSHFKSEVDGLDIHFIHEKGRGPNPIPLVITHGWPRSFPCWPTQPATAAMRTTPSMWSRHLCPASGSPTMLKTGAWRCSGWPVCGTS